MPRQFSLILIVFISLAASANGDSAQVMASGAPFAEKKAEDQDSVVVKSALTNMWQLREIKSPLEGPGLLTFANQNDGWISDGRFVRSTSDGGSSWSDISIKLPPKSSIVRLKLLGNNYGIAAVRGLVNDYYFGPSSESRAWLFVTADAGKTWKQTFNESSIELYSLTATADGTIIIDGERFLEAKSRSRAEYFLMKSGDFGNSWVKIAPLKNGERGVRDSLRQQDTPGAVEIVTPNNFRAISHYSRTLFESKDGGNSWLIIGRYLHDDAQVGIENFGKKDDGSEWMFESTYSIEGVRARLKTVSTKKVVERRMLGSYYLSDAYYVGTNTFIASGRYGDLRQDHDRATILISDDDARTWAELYRGEKKGSINSMVQVNRNLLWAITDNGTLIKIQRN
jgi:photosystem II stability/assembly factor-like uncharacterized protein